MDYRKESLKKHYEWKGKIETTPRVKVLNKEDLSLAYTPGVAEACLEIEKDNSKSYDLTRRWNTVAVITDGTAVLGLGDIGPLASMPVMEGKCLLFRTFANIDAIPICLNTKDTDELIRTIYLMSGSFGGINLEDISAPRCFEIERKLKEICDIPVFHDDQHGTAIVLGAALINSLKLVNKKIDEIKIVINGAGAAGISICKFLLLLGAKNIIMCDKFGILVENKKEMNEAQKEISLVTNRERIDGILKDAIKGSDCFIGVSGPNLVTKDMIKSMNEKAICFPMANPTPEIDPLDAIDAGAYIVGSGRSDYDNQVNNVLVFPGIFRGALDARAKDITDNMKIAACYSLASIIKDEDLNTKNILPKAFDKGVSETIAEAVKNAYLKEKI